MPGDGGLIERIAQMDSRLGAVEAEGIDETTILSRVFKLYGDIEVRAVITIRKHQYKLCGTFVCSPTAYI